MSQPVVDFPAVYLQTVLTKWGEGYEQRLCALLKQLPYSVARTCLEDSCAKVSPYDYERLEFILQQLVALEEKMTEGNLEEISKNLTVLQWMKLYERQAPPSKYDLDYSEGCESVTRDCTSISTTAMASLRLPYHALIMGNPQNIINPELNLCSMESLLKVAPLLKISSNDIFVVTIKNVASKLQQLGSAAASPQMVQSLEEIFERITDPHLAMVCGQWLKHLLKGEHRTQMLKKTAHFAKYWLYAASTKEEKLRASEKFEDLVHEVKQSTLLHLLEKNNLDSPEAVELVSLPEDLVVHLYTERGSREGSNPSEAPNVHEIAMETASIFHINIKMVKKQLLNSWLHLATTGRKENLLEATLDATQLSLDETLQIANGIQDTESDPQKEDIYFRRLVYLTSEQEKIEENVATLLSYAKHSSSAFPYKCRVLALRLVLHIASCDMVERISQRTIADIMYLKQVFHFLSELELVNINTNLQAYESCDKTAFVKMILKTHGHQPKALQTAVDIMAFHGIFDESLWNQTLHGLMNLKQVKALRRAVVWLSRSSPPDCQVSSAVDAWDCVLRQPLQDAELPLTSGIRDSLLDTFYLLLVCPCIFSLDMKYFIKSYHRLQMPECALVCTYLVPSIVDRKTLLKNIVKSLNSVEEVKRNLQKLSVSREILTAVTQILNESDSHDESAELFYYV
jgi:kinetochore-associated protein 1